MTTSFYITGDNSSCSYFVVSKRLQNWLVVLLTNHVVPMWWDLIDDQSVLGQNIAMPMKRTSYVVMTHEARVLRRLRERSKLSMREAGDLMGYSSSFVSQVENGRANPPTGEP